MDFSLTSRQNVNNNIRSIRSLLRMLEVKCIWKCMGRIGKKVWCLKLWGFIHKNKLQNIIIFMYLNRELINFSLRVGLIVFVWLWWIMSRIRSSSLLLFWELFVFTVSKVNVNVKTFGIECYDNDFNHIKFIKYIIYECYKWVCNKIKQK